MGSALRGQPRLLPARVAADQGFRLPGPPGSARVGADVGRVVEQRLHNAPGLLDAVLSGEEFDGRRRSRRAAGARTAPAVRPARGRTRCPGGPGARIVRPAQTVAAAGPDPGRSAARSGWGRPWSAGKGRPAGARDAGTAAPRSPCAAAPCRPAGRLGRRPSASCRSPAAAPASRQWVMMATLCGKAVILQP